ncbi:DNA gyrase inhibitor YacG [Alloyangia pacifica]|uniref:DNA gyrase inhibitor YacG n=1 Tax=Alloyangia pacifica TaxID=311180 RepID=UPI0031CDCD87
MSCPICAKPTDAKYRPFCSKRCADVDLAKWMSGSYAVPSDDPQDVEEAIELAEREQAKQTRH